MANTLENLTPELWSREMQEIREKDLVAMAIANTAISSQMVYGDTFHMPYRSNLHAVNYTKGTDLNRQDVSSTDETLSVDQIKAVPIYLDHIDQVQNSYDTQMALAGDMQRDLDRVLDAEVLSAYAEASSNVDAGDVGGSSGTAVTLTTSNVDGVILAAKRYLTRLNVRLDNRFLVISPYFEQVLLDYLSGKDSNLGDTVGTNGHIGKRFGFDIYVSNNLTQTATWTPANNPSDGDTVTINGVVFTFNTTPSAAGSVDIGGSTAASIDNLVAAVNNANGYAASAGSATAYFEVTTSDRALIESCVATDGTTVMTIEFKGAGEIALAASEVADPWSLQIAHALAGRKGATSVAIQESPTVDVMKDPDRIGHNLTAHSLYGVKTFNDGADALVDIRLLASSWV